LTIQQNIIHCIKHGVHTFIESVCNRTRK